jgi:hypothetical protein
MYLHSQLLINLLPDTKMVHQYGNQKLTLLMLVILSNYKVELLHLLQEILDPGHGQDLISRELFLLQLTIQQELQVFYLLLQLQLLPLLPHVWHVLVLKMYGVQEHIHSILKLSILINKMQQHKLVL